MKIENLSTLSLSLSHSLKTSTITHTHTHTHKWFFFRERERESRDRIKKNVFEDDVTLTYVSVLQRLQILLSVCLQTAQIVITHPIPWTYQSNTLYRTYEFRLKSLYTHCVTSGVYTILYFLCENRSKPHPIRLLLPSSFSRNFRSLS